MAEPGHVEQVLDVAIEALALVQDRVEQRGAVARRHLRAVGSRGWWRRRSSTPAASAGRATPTTAARRAGARSRPARARSRGRATRCVRSAARPMSADHRLGELALLGARGAAVRKAPGPDRAGAAARSPSGRNHQPAEASVSVKRPAACRCAHDQSAAARSLPDHRRRTGGVRRTQRLALGGAASTTTRRSSAAASASAPARSTWPSSAAAASFWPSACSAWRAGVGRAQRQHLHAQPVRPAGRRPAPRPGRGRPRPRWSVRWMVNDSRGSVKKKL